MPSDAERRAIEDNKLGLRVLDPGGNLLSGSFYMLFPVEGDWEARLTRTCQIIAKASRPEKRLHMLRNCPGAVSGEFGEPGDPSLKYGRLVSREASSISNAGLWGVETAEDIRGFVMRGIRSQIPREQVVDMGAAATEEAGITLPSFTDCCRRLAYLFTCCNPNYQRLDEEDDELDLL